MTQELQHLLDAIQKDGVDKAEAEAQRIVSEAREQARQTLEQANAEAGAIREQAEKDADAFQERANHELEQAARNVIIALGRGIENLLRLTVADAVGEAMSPDTLKEILLRIAESYIAEQRQGQVLELFLSQEDERALAEFFTTKMREKLQRGVVVHPSFKIRKGFQVSLRDQQFYHDFTQEAVTDEMCHYLQPRLEKIVRRAIESDKEQS